MEKLVEKLENTERVERDLYWTRVRHEFYQEMIGRGFVFKERPNEAIDVPIKDKKSPLSEPQGSPPDVTDRIMPPKSAPMTQAAIRRMIKESVDAAISVERARVEGAVELQRWFEKTEIVFEKTKIVFEISEYADGKKVKFAIAILEGPALTWWKTKVATMGLETVNQMPW
ncbi:hypothetical protein Tco_0176157, partial [Tanacetum coccineum]